VGSYDQFRVAAVSLTPRGGARAGVANIMAYSWLSHCKRYLELLEGEKRFLKKYKARARRRAPPPLGSQPPGITDGGAGRERL